MFSIYRVFHQISNYLKGFKELSFKGIINDWSIYELLWLVSSVLVLAIVSIITTSDYLFLTTLATITGMINMLLIAKGKIISYFFGFINNLAYAYVCYVEGIYGQFLLFLFFFFPMQFYGLYVWTKPGNTDQNNTVITNSLTALQRVYLVIAIIFAAALYGSIVLKSIFNQQIGLIADSLTGVVSVAAMILMVRVYIEQWMLWIVINTLSAIIWIQQYLFGTGDGVAFLVMWLIYLLNAVYGYINWRRMLK